MSLPEMIDVKSSNIAQIGYDDKTNTAYLKFKNGYIYKYNDVPKHEFDTLKHASSCGSHYHQNWRGKYSSEYCSGKEKK